MALFEFEQGRLIPAQFGHPVDQGLEPDILEAIRTQVLEVIERPLFPVTWHNTDAEPGQHRLTALDASGQVVLVELLNRLDPVSLISALSRLGDIAALGWLDLATRYPGGPEAFRSGWADFREAMPPHTEPGPRLILVVGELDDAVRPALGVLFQSGMEIHEVRLREMSNGRRFLEVMRVRHEPVSLSKRLAARASAPAQLTWGDTGDMPAVRDADTEIVEGEADDSASSADVDDDNEPMDSPLGPGGRNLFGDDYVDDAPQGTQPVPPPADVTTEGDDDTPVDADTHTEDSSEDTELTAEIAAQKYEHPVGSVDSPAPADPEPSEEATADEAADESPVAADDDDSAPSDDDSAPSENTDEAESQPAGKTQDESEHDSSEGHKRRKPEHVAEREPIPGIIGLNAEGLYAIAQVIGQDAQLLWKDGETTHSAILKHDGTIDCGNDFSTTDVEESLLKVTGRGDLIAWKSWRIGHENGPTLSEAIDEINAEIYRETMAAQEQRED